MKIRCPYCGSPNETVGKELDSTATCSVCQKSLERPQGAPPRERLSYGQAEPDQLFDETDWGSKAAPLENAPTGSLSTVGRIDSLLGSLGPALGSLPTEDEGVDISAILDESGSGLIAPTPASDHSQGGWRIRTARGIVYELGSTSEVAQRLADWTDLSQIKVARGLGPFLDVDSYAEFSVQRETAVPKGADGLVSSQNISQPEMSDFLVDVNPAVFSNTQSEIMAPTETAAELRTPQLDFDRASDRHGAGHERPRQPAPSQSPKSMTTVSDATNTKLKARGFRTVAVLILVSMLAGVLILESGVKAPDARAKITDVSRTPQIRAAIKSADEAMQAGKYTTAAQILERIARDSTEPQVFRRLAIALDRTNRPLEASKAFKMYRKFAGMEPNQ